MKTHLLLIIILTLLLTVPTYADRAMTQSESQGVVQTLAGSPALTWISAGTIVATHEEFRAARTTDEAEIEAEIQRQIEAYKANPNKRERDAEAQERALAAIPFNVRYKWSNEYSMTSKVTLKYDGDRFSWSIDITARSDSIAPPDDMKDNDALEYFNLDWNASRTFLWDGQKYTQVNGSMNQAYVDAAGKRPHNVNGPLTAGIVAWGYGQLSSVNLKSATVNAAEVTRDGKAQIDMMVQSTDGSTMTFTMDPAKDNAVTAYTWRGNSKRVKANQYSGHEKVGGRWVPMTILVEERDLETDRLVKSDRWDFSSIDAKVPRDFNAQLTTGTRVEYSSPLSARPAVYTYSNTVDTDGLLAEQLAFGVARSRSPQNCATAALKCVGYQFGKTVSDTDLSRLVGPDGRTSLQTLGEAARQMGLYTRAVKTDVAGLKKLGDGKAILHLSSNDHFVVADAVEGSEVWLVDLSAEKFYYRMSIDRLRTEWSDGVALLVSTQPILGTFADIEKTRLAATIRGGGKSCTGILYAADYTPCFFDLTYGCDGYCREDFERLKCVTDVSGSCVAVPGLPRYAEILCVSDPEQPYNCVFSGDWIYHYTNKACG